MSLLASPRQEESSLATTCTRSGHLAARGQYVAHDKEL